MEWIFVKQIIAETPDNEQMEFMNLINTNCIKRIAFVKGKERADIFFSTPTTVIKNDQYEDLISIEVKDKKAFVEALKPIFRSI